MNVAFTIAFCSALKLASLFNADRASFLFSEKCYNIKSVHYNGLFLIAEYKTVSVTPNDHSKLSYVFAIVEKVMTLAGNCALNLPTI